MSERLLWPDYDIRGHEFEVWAENGPYHWWLATDREDVAKACGVPVNTVLTGDEFSPPLTDKEIQRIYDAVYDYYAE